MHTDGLHISGCEGENDIVIPVAQPGAVIMLNIINNNTYISTTISNTITWGLTGASGEPGEILT